MRMKYSLLIMVMCIILVVTGCGSKDSATGTDGRIEIEMVHWSNKARRKAFM